jgi:hypothetical protein
MRSSQWIKRRSVVDQDVEAAQVRDRAGDDVRQHGEIEQICLHENGRIRTPLVERLLQGTGGIVRTMEVDRYARALRVKACGERRADSLGGARDQHDLVVQRTCDRMLRFRAHMNMFAELIVRNRA